MYVCVCAHTCTCVCQAGPSNFVLGSCCCCWLCPDQETVESIQAAMIPRVSHTHTHTHTRMLPSSSLSQALSLSSQEKAWSLGPVETCRKELWGLLSAAHSSETRHRPGARRETNLQKHSRGHPWQFRIKNLYFLIQMWMWFYPSQGTKIPHISRYSQKIELKTC